jgi:hypothetical protein
LPTESDAYLGTWTGTVTSDTIGAGTATVVLDTGLKSAAATQVGGHWSFGFADSRYSASGTVSGGPLPDRSALVLLFSASLVPCPSETTGAATKGRTATLNVAADRMEGSYIANGCPGGTIVLRKN